MLTSLAEAFRDLRLALAWLVIALASGFLPSLRAARVDPAISLRYE